MMLRHLQGGSKVYYINTVQHSKKQAWWFKWKMQGKRCKTQPRDAKQDSKTQSITQKREQSVVAAKDTRFEAYIESNLTLITNMDMPEAVLIE